ncbi:hypothetical protein M501DRAFT_939190 [Patellaria atrata CBS 101060]|uniref:HRQ family protein n=1 Tax=Patellaria atrata CBS 101060 TaxID=1346257 RepID=A0A9P4S7W8_9PEZI|nr:hypothetical protein M501DRAFT_939190 [Patellaria atrata CBS 101060]
MAIILLWLLAATFALSTASYLAFNKRRREIVVNRFFKRRRDSGSRTPPRSLSPEKKGSQEPPSPDYSDTLPPSRRFTLDSIPGLKVPLVPEKKRFIPLDVPYDAVDGTAFTATGFSTDDIKALGDFPDYATLSGVPLPEPYPEFDITTAKPRPYRPLRWAYHQTMSLTKMEPDWWLELEDTYIKRVKQRCEIFEKVGHHVLAGLPGSELACKELMEMCLQFLCVRYPHYFNLDKENMKFENKILETITDLKTTPPLHVIIQNVPEDFGIMLRNPETGLYQLRAGVICSALGWNKPTDKPIQRGSWGLEVDQPLYMPPGDPHEKYRESQVPDVSLDRMHLRVDWQTLRRLPLSGAVVFNFKALFTPVAEFRDEAYIPTLLLKVIKDGKKNLMDYKNTWHTEHVVVPALEAYEREQVERGVVEREWEPKTLDESPWFPGWEEKWRRQQGF